MGNTPKETSFFFLFSFSIFGDNLKGCTLGIQFLTPSSSIITYLLNKITLSDEASGTPQGGQCRPHMMFSASMCICELAMLHNVAVVECENMCQDNETECHGQYTAARHSFCARSTPSQVMAVCLDALVALVNLRLVLLLFGIPCRTTSPAMCALFLPITLRFHDVCPFGCSVVILGRNLVNVVIPPPPQGRCRRRNGPPGFCFENNSAWIVLVHPCIRFQNSKYCPTYPSVDPCPYFLVCTPTVC